MTIYRLGSGSPAQVRTNLARDPGTDSSGTLLEAAYGGGGAGSFVRVAAGNPNVPNEWAYAMVTVTTSATTWFRIRQTNAGRSTVSPLTTYTVSAWVHGSVASGVSWLIQCFDSGGSTVGADIRSSSFSINDTWNRVSYTFTTPASAASIRVGIDQLGATVGEVMRMTGLLVERSNILGTYFDGSTPSTPAAQHAWTGTPNASTSTETSPGADERLTPLLVLAPYSAEFPVRTVAHQILHSSFPRFSSFPMANRGHGELEILFASYLDAREAIDYFTQIPQAWFYLEDSTFEGYYNELSFRVTEGSARVVQDDEPSHWRVVIPFTAILGGM